MTPTNSVRQCSLCAEVVVGDFNPGPSRRPDAACPRCRSLERHRFLALLLRSSAASLAMARTVLDVAPSRHTTRMLDDLCAPFVIGMDFDPSADGRQVNLQASLTDVPLPDDSVDLLLCYHVLEHIPDDRAAIAEIGRVLAPGAQGYLQVPWRPDHLTDEDPTADRETRLARFGQANHVRYYGSDFENRLIEGGLDVCRVRPTDLLDPDECRRFNVPPDEAVWIVSPARHDKGRLVTLEQIHPPRLSDPRVERLRTSVARADRARALSEERYLSLRSRWPIRVAVRFRSLLRQLLRRS